MKKYWVYIILCADNTYYVGVTNNIVFRFFLHQEGSNKKAYTFSRRPLKLVFQTGFHDIRSAIDFEKRIKKWSSSKKKALCEGKFELLPWLSRKRNRNGK